MAAGDPALGAIDETLPAEILTDIKLQDLSGADGAGKKIRVVDEVLGVRDQGFVGVRQIQYGRRANHWVAPQHI
jgi:hypothetical protein